MTNRRYWWVNHNQTFQTESGKSYLWCPTRNKAGHTIRYYENMREVQPGDMVFLYAKSAIQGYGFAKDYCYSCPRYDEFGKIGKQLNELGRRVDVGFHKFKKPLKPATIYSIIKPLLAEKYAPLDKNGNGVQGIYLTEIGEQLARELVDQIDRKHASDIFETHQEINEYLRPQRIIEIEDRVEEQIRNKGLAPTEVKTLIASRRGQGKFRKDVFNMEKSCRITKVENFDYLIASHIKPWRECDDEERLCAANGLALTPSVDLLFDRGLISFEDNGELHISPVADEVSLKRMKIPPEEIKPYTFNTDQKHFLDYHRKQIFLKTDRK